VIDEDGTQLGILPIRDARRVAEDKNLDLVNVAPTARPPVCRVMDYGKFKYEQSKKEKEARKNQKVIELKEVRMTPNIEEHDFQVKLRNVVKFLNEGDKVKVSVRFRGREITHSSIGQQVLMRLAQGVSEQAIVERLPKLEGRHMIMILSPKQAQVQSQ
jgi:translation initiation factor IF-3